MAAMGGAEEEEDDDFRPVRVRSVTKPPTAPSTGKRAVTAASKTSTSLKKPRISSSKGGSGSSGASSRPQAVPSTPHVGAKAATGVLTPLAHSSSAHAPESLQAPLVSGDRAEHAIGNPHAINNGQMSATITTATPSRRVDASSDGAKTAIAPSTFTTASAQAVSQAARGNTATPARTPTKGGRTAGAAGAGVGRSGGRGKAAAKGLNTPPKVF